MEKIIKVAVLSFALIVAFIVLINLVGCGTDANQGGAQPVADSGEPAKDVGHQADGSVDTGVLPDGSVWPDGGQDAGKDAEVPADTGVDSGVDAEVQDVGLPDAGEDVGLPDVGLPDAGEDAGVLDGGEDVGLPDIGEVDGGTPDAGETDAGVPDAGAGDQPPTAKFISPKGGEHLNGAVAVMIEAADDVGVVQAMFFADSNIFYTCNAFPCQPVWNSDISSEGVHQLKVIVTDTKGQQGEAVIDVTVDRTAPTASFLSPTDAFVVGDQAAVSLEAGDNFGLGSVKLFYSGPASGDLTEFNQPPLVSPFAYNWNMALLPSGWYKLKAVVTDLAGLEVSAEFNLLLDRPPTMELGVCEEYYINCAPVAGQSAKGGLYLLVTIQDDLPGAEVFEASLKKDGNEYTPYLEVGAAPSHYWLQVRYVPPGGPYDLLVTVKDSQGHTVNRGGQVYVLSCDEDNDGVEARECWGYDCDDLNPAVPGCAGKFCGDDNGCGGKCEGCVQTGDVCLYTPNYHCCTPNCVGKFCGDDNGCGGKCEGCASPLQLCDTTAWSCQDKCTHATCAAQAECQTWCGGSDFWCVSGACQPCSRSCAGKSCGDPDGCLGKCNVACADPVKQFCDTAVWQCRDKCAYLTCASHAECQSWCGGSDFLCNGGACQPCVRDCSGKFCGESDGCDGKCTACVNAGEVCDPADWTCKDPCLQACALDSECPIQCGGSTDFWCLDATCTLCSPAPTEGAICADNSTCGCLPCAKQAGAAKGDCLRDCSLNQVCGDDAQTCGCLNWDSATGDCLGRSCFKPAQLTGNFNTKVSSDCSNLPDMGTGTVTYTLGETYAFSTFYACQNTAGMVQIMGYGAVSGGYHQLLVLVPAASLHLGAMPVDAVLYVRHDQVFLSGSTVTDYWLRGLGIGGTVNFTVAGTGNRNPIAGSFNVTMGKYDYQNCGPGGDPC